MIFNLLFPHLESSLVQLLEPIYFLYAFWASLTLIVEEGCHIFWVIVLDVAEEMKQVLVRLILVPQLFLSVVRKVLIGAARARFVRLIS
jgi:hypothetical protein